MSFFGDDDAGAEDGLRVNDTFAEKYHDRKRRQELAQAREAGLLDAQGELVSDSESSSDEEEDAMPRDEGLQVMHVLNMIRKKDPAIYKQDSVFFTKEEPAESSDEDSGKADEAASSGHKRMTVKDIVRDQVLAAAEAGKDDAFEDDEAMAVAKPTVHMGEKVYDAEQAALRAAVLDAGLPAHDSDGEDDDFLQQSKKPVAAAASGAAEPQVDEEILKSAREWVGAVHRAPPTVDEDKILNLEAAGTGEMTEQAQDYLKWFTATRAWEGDAADDDDADSIDEDAEALDKADAFEATYNFRFEDPEGAMIATHPRTTESSIRRKESKRKRQREAKAQRRAEDKAEREEEQKRLINLKREEEQQRMEKLLGEAGKGLDERRAAQVLAALEAGEWNEADYDKLMTSAFGDEYYMEDEGDDDEAGAVKPTAPAWMLAGDEDDEEGAAAAGAGGASGGGQGGHSSDDEGSEHGADAALEDEDEEEGATAISTAQLAAQLSAASRRVVEAAVADAEADIGYEDVIAGGTIKTKFKYRSVPAADFGLETDTILRAPDKLLNTFVGLKKLAPYRDSEYSLTAKRAKKAREALQASIEEAEAAAEAAGKARSRARKEARRAAAEGDGAGKKKKESRKARAKRAEEARGSKRAREESEGEDAEAAAAAAQGERSDAGSDSGAEAATAVPKARKSSSVMAEATSKGISNARLASYGAVVQDAVGKKNRRRSKKARKD